MSAIDLFDSGLDPFSPAALAVAEPKKKKRGKVSPTQRSLKWWRERGCVAQVVEKYNPHSKTRLDLFGVIDIVVLDPAKAETIGVQSTSLDNVSARVTKITECEHLAALRKCGWRLIVDGWGKDSKGSIRLRQVDVS